MFAVADRTVVVFVAVGFAEAALASGGAPLFAYIDPGSAGFVIVSMLGFLTAVGYTIRQHLSQIKRRVRRVIGRSRKSPQGGEAEEAEPPIARDADG